MNRQELASLLSQTQSMMAPSRAPTPSYHRSSPLSPRQRFQSQIRTLHDSPRTPPRNSVTTPQTSPRLQHVSSLRVQRGSSSPPAWTVGESALDTFNHGPQFITEEREVWGRPSPLRTNKAFVEGISLVAHSVDSSPVDPHKLRPFAPSSRSLDVNDRPKTRRGPNTGSSSFGENNADRLQQEQEQSTRPSKFAEGSMNDRSAGVSSTWNDHGSLASISGTDESDNDTTPRPSPRRSSIDVNEFNPQPVAAPTFTQRLFKLGTKAKPKDVSKAVVSKTEQDLQTVRKKKGLRKSMSLWNLHGDKRKAAASQPDLNNPSPEKSNVDVLNDRKRRAEEAYFQQFGMKRRKSNVALATSDDESAEKPPAATRGRTPSRRIPSSAKRRLSWSSSTIVTAESTTFDGVNDVDLQKRPSRRELEKENQQLRAMLKQEREGARVATVTIEPITPSSRVLSLKLPSSHEADKTPLHESSNKKSSRENLGVSPPPVPPLPTIERAALQPLNNTRNVPRKTTSQDDLKTIPEDTFERGRPRNAQPRKATAKHSRRASLARGAELPRAVSMILEQDEGSEAEKQPTKENLHPMKHIPKLIPTPIGSPKRVATAKGVKIHEDAAVQAKAVERENWEWPDDVF
ncbi:hypothetical protein G647_03900 [Cladophialophora carrionii CBS 160.54]|uniref:Uncharacterized protein n=1 Tax=Cladophialophora carrionii CBS 160.54 TaxID=1279043 RepID=V9DCX7_9EURO|nr:uncharacterized protein G647_03900 [Cladophialophora carrionii CBS 160.54]ETI24531.1 hypothetical protein G647_03900 [Cladophialophora carrionii CBS 160.54]